MKLLKQNLFLLIILLSITSCYSPPKNSTITWDKRLSKGFYHRVAKGETIYSLAKYYRKNVEILILINKIKDPKKIRVGDPVFIPTNRYAAYYAQKKSKQLTAGSWHRVVRGDTIYSIARYYGKDVEILSRFNRFKDPKKLRVGELVFIPTDAYAAYFAHTTNIRATQQVPRSAQKKSVRAARVSPVSKVKGPALQSRKTPKTPVARKSSGSKSSKSSKKTIISTKLSSVSTAAFTWPLKGEIITRFNKSRKIYGIDIAAKRGTKVKAARSGKVLYSGSRIPGFGNTVIIEHIGGLATVYGHNDRNLVRMDQYVRQGAVIATVGHSGETEQDMLHFEIRRNAKAVDPLKYLN